MVRIVDPESRQALGEGRVGEVWVDGPSKGGGYWHRPELTAEMFGARIAGDEEHTYLRTGDLGFLYEGELFVCGRTKDLIIVRGVNCYPADIEAIVERSAPRSPPRLRRRLLGRARGAGSAGRGRRGAGRARAPGRQGPGPSDPQARPHRSAHHRVRAAAQHSQDHLGEDQARGDPPALAGRQAARAGDLGRPEGPRTHDGPDASAGPHGTLPPSHRELRPHRAGRLLLRGSRHRLAGLAELRADLQALLEEHGAAELAEEVNTRLLQRLTVAEFFRLMRQFGEGSGQPLDALRQALDQISAEYEASETTQMRADARLPLPALPPARAGAESDILVTGVTGFLGPFLVSSLLGRTSYTLHALIRATDAEHGLDRIVASLRRAQLWSSALEAEVRARVRVICGDLAEPHLGIGEAAFQRLAESVDAIVHNGALVNYVRTYDALRPANVVGTHELLRLAMTSHRKAFHLVSSTFIYGWSTLPVVGECDANEEMSGLDFGYSQTKWVAEQLVLAAQRQGLDVRIYRPSLISPTSAGFGSQEDILVRTTAFMIEHGMAVNAHNQFSLLPADLIADHIVALMDLPAEAGTVFNMTADDYYNLMDITRVLSERHGYHFTYHDIPSFAEQMNRRCAPRDPIYPLVDFLTRSAGQDRGDAGQALRQHPVPARALAGQGPPATSRP